MATEETTGHLGETPEAPAETEHGDQTGMQRLVEDLGQRRDKVKLGGHREDRQAA